MNLSQKYFLPCIYLVHVCTKNQQNIYKESEHNGRTVFMRVSSGGVNFVFYPLSSINFTSSLFATTYLFTSASDTAGVPPPPDRMGIINSNTASPSTVYEALVTADYLHQPLRFRRRIYCCTRRRLQQSPSLLPTSYICRHHHLRRRRQW